MIHWTHSPVKYCHHTKRLFSNLPSWMWKSNRKLDLQKVFCWIIVFLSTWSMRKFPSISLPTWQPYGFCSFSSISLLPQGNISGVFYPRCTPLFLTLLALRRLLAALQSNTKKLESAWLSIEEFHFSCCICFL